VQPIDLGDNAGPTYGTSTTRAATVRPTSLGIMAANVTYSPAPSYPPAASAAHVQGEVKLEAEVGPDGNVTSARVISGPPLLREAAANALEHWHYRPYIADGKPIAMSALVVMDFQLP
jgi:TonB family protein